VDFDGFVTADRLDGPVTLRRFVARRVSFGNETLRDQPVFVLPDTADLPGVGGVIGARRLASPTRASRWRHTPAARPAT
jgi:hypothetical protein